ncbi:MAG TPA: RNA-guided endonuclease TnpB family protein [Micromonosporaceae bacterium]
MQLRYKYRIYPTTSQKAALARAFGCARVVFNDGLRTRQQAREAGLPFPTDAELSKALTKAKQTDERAWLAEVSSVVLQQALADLNAAFRNFFSSASGKRKGRKIGPPRFRSRKDCHQTIRYTKNSQFKVLNNGRLRLPKIGDVQVRWSRELASNPSSVTIIRDAAGRYFASFVVRTRDEPLPISPSEVGIDLGLKDFVVLSDGTKVAAPRLLRQASRKLKKLQKSASRKRPGSRNRRKASEKLARTHARVADARRDWHHKLSTTIVRDNQAVFVEDLSVWGLGRTRLAKSVHDAGWGQFLAMLEYKSAMYGREFARIDRFYPSTRRCSDCGVVANTMLPSVRSWDCRCGSHHDRDVDAALNILAAGRADRLNDRGAQVRPPTKVAQRIETVIEPMPTSGNRCGVGKSPPPWR